MISLSNKNTDLIKGLGIFLVVCLTLFPILRILHFLFLFGDINPSNDHVEFIHVLDQVLAGTYSWPNLFRDTFSVASGHSLTLPILAQVLLSFLSKRYLFVLPIFIGLFLQIIKLFLIFNIFTFKTKRWEKWLLLPVLSFLVFSPSQISIFEFDFAIIGEAFYHLGLTIGIWGLVRFPNKWMGIFLVIIGGFFASWSYGGGPLLWPIFLLGMILFGYRNFKYYLIFCFSGLVSIFPYFYFLFLDPHSASPPQLVSLFNFKLLVRYIGLPLSSRLEVNSEFTSGVFGILFLASGIFLLVQRGKKAFHQALPALMFIGFSLLNMLQIILFRTNITPWYSSPFSFFWIGLVGLAYLFVTNQKDFSLFPIRGNSKNIASFIWSFSYLGVLAFLYWTTNQTIADKSYYLRSRTPVSASCLRNYKTAPTYCEQTLFLWKPGYFNYLEMLAAPLERHNLSVFSPRQIWSLQGEFILGNVNMAETPGVPGIFWTKDLSTTPIKWSGTEYRHLNLFLHTPNSIKWEVSLPSNLKKAELHSAVAISRSAPYDPESNGIIFEVMIEPEGGTKKGYFAKYVAPDQREWQDFSIPLTQFKGQTVTLHLGSKFGENLLHDWGMYRFPYIDILLEGENSNKETRGIRPSNTDLSTKMPKPTENDYVFEIGDKTQWNVNGMTPVISDEKQIDRWILSEDPSFEYKMPLNLELKDYTNIYFRIKISPIFSPISSQVWFQIDGQEGFQKNVYIPLLADGKFHQYTFDLKLLNLSSQNRLTSIRLDPVDILPNLGNSEIQISDFRLIRNSNSSIGE